MVAVIGAMNPQQPQAIPRAMEIAKNSGCNSCRRPVRESPSGVTSL
jgi:hypothetical protein